MLRPRESFGPTNWEIICRRRRERKREVNRKSFSAKKLGIWKRHANKQTSASSTHRKWIHKMYLNLDIGRQIQKKRKTQICRQTKQVKRAWAREGEPSTFIH